mgnify:CR=1 FL=1|tara:strand:- start:110 stop:256 length:147 start_codon:yes stop_codon:yes gene_type:complete
MMDIIEALGTPTVYGLAWLAISAGAALFIASVFFGIVEVKRGKDRDDL